MSTSAVAHPTVGTANQSGISGLKFLPFEPTEEMWGLCAVVACDLHEVRISSRASRTDPPDQQRFPQEPGDPAEHARAEFHFLRAEVIGSSP